MGTVLRGGTKFWVAVSSKFLVCTLFDFASVNCETIMLIMAHHFQLIIECNGQVVPIFAFISEFNQLSFFMFSFSLSRQMPLYNILH